jgi:hypothetical protein
MVSEMKLIVWLRFNAQLKIIPQQYTNIANMFVIMSVIQWQDWKLQQSISAICAETMHNNICVIGRYFGGQRTVSSAA